jgi:hypothetical protein
MKTIESILGPFPVSRITMQHVAKVRDKFQETPAKANGVSRMFSRLLSYAVAPSGWIAVNPCQGLKLMKHGNGQSPLLEIEIARFRNANPIGTRARLAFEICLATALRISDVVMVTRDQLRELLIASVSPAKFRKTLTRLRILGSQHLDPVLCHRAVPRSVPQWRVQDDITGPASIGAARSTG